MKIKALHGKVLVTDLETGARVVRGFYVPNDNGKSEGIRPRWGKVYSKGDDVEGIEVGQWILIENGRWTRMVEVKDEVTNEVTKLWSVEYPKSVLLVSDEFPEEAEIFSQFTSSI